VSFATNGDEPTCVGLRNGIWRCTLPAMARVQDVAAYIVNQRGSMSSPQLHVLLYYVQAWWLARHDAPVFDACLEASVTGPVVSALVDEQATIGDARESACPTNR